MSNLKGSFLIIFKEVKIQYITFTLVTLFLALLYLAVGYYAQPSDFSPLLSGPILGIFALLPFFMFSDPYKAAIELGATRKNYLYSLFLNMLMFVIGILIFHELLSQIIKFISHKTDTHITLIRLGELITNPSIFDFLWLDFLFAIFIVGLCLLLSSIIYRLGFVTTLILILIISVSLFLWYVLGDVMPMLKWISNHWYLFFHLLALTGLCSCFATYIIMFKAKINV